MTAAARTMPSGSDDPRKTGSNWGILEAATMASRKARNIPAPPAVGVGRAWSRRSSGLTTAPKRMDRRRTTKVSRKVAPAAIASTSAYPPMAA